MWPYAKRGTRFYGDIDERMPSRLGGQRFDVNDAVIKLWLPERLLVGVDVLSCEHNVSRPDIVRWLLFEHVFGRVEFVHLKRRDRGELEDVPAFSLRRDAVIHARAVRVRFLGKSESDLKLELPSALKKALEELAGGLDQALSDYVRGALARELLPEAEWLNLRHQEADQ
jgi:hypothetical protein